MIFNQLNSRIENKKNKNAETSQDEFEKSQQSIDNSYNHLSFTELHDLLVENNFAIFTQKNFTLKYLIYKHREWVYQGILNDENCSEVYIKKYSVNSEEELQIAINEINIIISISRSTYLNKMLNKFLGVFIDIEENYLYSFYEYVSYEKCSLSLNLNNLNYFEKLIITKNLLEFTYYIHSLGIIHRDIRLDYFFIDHSLNIKIFDFTNAILLEEVQVVQKQFKDYRDLEDVSKLIKYKFNNPYLTAKFTAPELSICKPREGWAQDIWSLGCSLIELFIDRTKYEDGIVEVLLTKIFRSESVPKIPKELEQNVALIIAKCFYLEPFSRLDSLQLIEKFNKYFKKNHFETIEITLNPNFDNVKELYRQNYIYQFFQLKQQRKSNKTRKIEMCKYNHGKPNSFYCESCDDFFCQNCIEMTHLHHLFFDIELQLQSKTKILESLIMEIEDKFCDTNFLLIESFKSTFEQDFVKEEKRIKSQFDSIRKKIDFIEKLELDNLYRSRQNILDSKFTKLFNESDNVFEFYKIFYNSKDQFFSYYNRFMSSINNNEVEIDYVREFNAKFNKFNECAEILKTNSERLISKSSSLRIPGKYIFRHENYTGELLKSLKSLENKIYMEKHKFFEYSGNDSLYLSQEFLMIIPLTDCVFSYNKNSYKKIQVNFIDNDIKIKSFVPGCATLHMGGNFYITGGEIKEESLSSFLWMNVEEKIIEESVEMYSSHRYHTMIGIENKFILVIGGWNSREVEMINIESLDAWEVLPSMKNLRSDATVYLCDKTFLYVFGGWNFLEKTCVGEIERYELLDSECKVKFNKHWEVIKIKNNPVYLNKYNMGLIPLPDERSDTSEKILLVGGFDEDYDYSPSVIKLEINLKQPSVFVNKDIKGLPTDGESSFWYEKNFHILHHETDKESFAVNFNCFNNIYVYSLTKNEFKLYTNSTAK